MTLNGPVWIFNNTEDADGTANSADSDQTAVLQIRRGNRDNLGIISHISKKKTNKKQQKNNNIFCDPSLEPSQ